MKPVLRYLGVGLALYLVFLLVLLPATKAYRYAAAPLARAMLQLQLAGIHGTVWSGSVGSVAYRNIPLGEAHWQLSPLSLLLGEASLSAMLQSREGYLQSRLRVPLGGGVMELSDVEGSLPVGELAAQLIKLPVVLGGTVSLDLQRLVLNPANGRLIDAEGSIIWHQAAMRAPQALSYGDLQLLLHAEEDGSLRGELRDRGGPLSISGTIQLSPDGGYTLNSTVAAADGASPELVKALGWLGKPDPQGRYRLNFSGRL